MTEEIKITSEERKETPTFQVERRRAGVPYSEVVLNQRLSNDLPSVSNPQVFSTSSFPREFRSEPSIYIGRKGLWGNRFVIGPDGDREEVLNKYEDYTIAKLRTDHEYRSNFVRDLSGKHLICHCKPLACHGDIILRLLQLIALNDKEVRPVVTPNNMRTPFFPSGPSVLIHESDSRD
jgi:hypothetical protein